MRRRRGYDRSLRWPPPLNVAMRYQASLRDWLRPWLEQLRVAAVESYRDPLGRVVGAAGGMRRPTHDGPMLLFTRSTADSELPRIDAPPFPRPPIEVIDRASLDTVAHVDKGLRRVYDSAGRYLGRRIPDAADTQRAKARLPGISLRQAAPRVSAQIPAFREANVALIKTIPERALVDVQSTLDEAWFNGMHSDEIGPLLEERFGVAEFEADRIARTEVLKLNAQVTEARHQALGIERYTWSTSGDERVREEHDALDGTEQSYDDPPDTGNGTNNPGEDIQCRCVAIPILPALDEENDE